MVCGTRAESGVDPPVARWCVPNTTVALPYSILCGTGRKMRIFGEECVHLLVLFIDLRSGL